MSSSNCCFLTCIQISQEAGQVVWCSHNLKNFQQFVVTYTVKGFGVINKAEIDVFFWNSLAFSMIQWMLELDLIECLKNYEQRFMTLYRRQWLRPSPRKRNAKRQNGCLRRPYKYLGKEEKIKAKEKRKDILIWMQSPKQWQGDIEKASSVINAKK